MNNGLLEDKINILCMIIEHKQGLEFLIPLKKNNNNLNFETDNFYGTITEFGHLLLYIIY